MGEMCLQRLPSYSGRLLEVSQASLFKRFLQINNRRIIGDSCCLIARSCRNSANL
jgi:hypothetical protein